jgi:aldose 1-epimerase
MKSAAPGAGIVNRPFGWMPDGRTVELYQLRNENGFEASITPYGGIVTSVMVPDRKGRYEDVVLGFDDLEGYLGPHPYFGAVIGRYANRISGGRFTLGGREFVLHCKDDGNHLHGGRSGFDKALWNARPGPGALELTLEYVSRDGEQGYPGQLEATVTYAVKPDNQLRIDYHCTTDKPTHVNLTNHSYFNLAGAGGGDVLDHLLTIDAEKFAPVDRALIPTGELREVAGTPMDFRSSCAVGARIDDEDEQLQIGSGYDHNFVVSRRGREPSLAARVVEPTSGRVMEVLTTEPGIQFYSANYLDGSIEGKGGVTYGRRCALCLETQHFPDSPNRPEFPSTVLRPGEEWRSTTVYRFSCK